MAINRYDLVTRHNPEVNGIDAYAALSVGNGEFAFTADITGLQTFPREYASGIPLCTQSQWGWHSKPADNETGSYHINDLEMEYFDTLTRKVGYRTDPQNQEEAYRWLRMNPHRLHLGQIGLKMIKQNGNPVIAEDLCNAKQNLNLWKGLLESSFEVKGDYITAQTDAHQGKEVKGNCITAQAGAHQGKTQSRDCIATKTCAHPSKDMVSFVVESHPASMERLAISIKLPYGTHLKAAADWDNDSAHYTEIEKSVQSACDKGDTGNCTKVGDGKRQDVILKHTLDKTIYNVRLAFSEGASFKRTGRNSFIISPAPGTAKLELSCLFSPLKYESQLPLFDQTLQESEKAWKDYWSNGGAIDFKNSTDPRATELERRVILSRYLMRVNCAGTLPPQETGLIFNSWYGKYHLEMHWWHGVHFPLWGQAELFEKSLGWYETILPVARELAQSQGYEGVRWPKMVAYDGIDSPSPIGPLLIWQQPHPIYYAALLYQLNPARQTLEKYSNIVFETANFMASYAEYNEEQNQFNLGPALIPAQENHRPQDVVNPTMELEYWAFGLNTANQWRKRLSLSPVEEWTKVAKGLAPLPVMDGVYLAHENCPDTYTRYRNDHPSMVYALGILPGFKADREIMLKTLKTVMEKWDFDGTWGWDFPMLAMTAARLGQPELAIDCLLMDAPKNEYLINGHNKQGDKADLPIYLPGNGGLLTAVAMMAAGWNGCTENTPGFPKDGSWCVTWEGLHPIL